MTASKSRGTHIVARIGAAALIVSALLAVKCTNTDGAAEVNQHEGAAANQASSDDVVDPTRSVAGAPEPESEMTATQSEELDAKIAEATSLLNRQKFDDARVILDQVLGERPNEGRALALLAQMQLELNTLEDALATANHCIAVDAQQAFCWVIIATLEQGENHLPRALEAYHKYLEIEPDGRFAKSARKQITRIEDKVRD